MKLTGTSFKDQNIAGMLHVLIADGDVDAWFRVNALLRRYLVKANLVTSFAAAKQWLDKHTPSLLFFDKQLQDQSAFDLVSYVRSRYPQTKIVMINSFVENNLASAPSADLNISKPFRPELIERTIINLLFPQSPACHPA